MKLEQQHKHILKLIYRDASVEGWCSVSEVLCKHIDKNIPKELVVFEKLDVGGRVKLTEEGNSIVRAMEWLL